MSIPIERFIELNPKDIKIQILRYFQELAHTVTTPSDVVRLTEL